MEVVGQIDRQRLVVLLGDRPTKFSGEEKARIVILNKESVSPPLSLLTIDKHTHGGLSPRIRASQAQRDRAVQLVAAAEAEPQK